MLNSLDSVRIFSFQGRAVLRDAGQILGSKEKKKKRKKNLLSLLFALPFAMRANPGWNVSGRGVQRPRRTEQQVKVNSESLESSPLNKKTDLELKKKVLTFPY